MKLSVYLLIGLEVAYTFASNNQDLDDDAVYDESNQVFNDKADSKRFSATFTTFYDKPFGWDLQANTSVIWFQKNSDIDFYDASISMVNIGMLYRF